MPPYSDPYTSKTVVLSNHRSTHYTPPVASLRIYDEAAALRRTTSTTAGQAGSTITSSTSSPRGRRNSVSTITMYNKPYRSYHDLALVRKPATSASKETVVRLGSVDVRSSSRDSSPSRRHSHHHSHSRHKRRDSDDDSSNSDDDRHHRHHHHHHHHHSSHHRRRHSISTTRASSSTLTDLVSYGSGPVPTRTGGGLLGFGSSSGRRSSEKLVTFGPDLSLRRPRVKSITAGDETVVVTRYR